MSAPRFAATLLPILLLASCAATSPSPSYSLSPATGLNGDSWLEIGQDEEANSAPSTPRPKRRRSSKPIRRNTILIGSRDVGDSFWEALELDDQGIFGFETDVYTPGELGYEMGIHFAGDSTDVPGASVDTTTIEFNGGARKTWGESGTKFHPYIGGGISLLITSLEASVSGFGSASETDGGLGFYVHGGAYFQVTDNLSVGIDLRKLSGTEIDFGGGLVTDADYIQTTFTIGFSF